VTPARTVFRMATEYGAICLGYDDLGRIEEGYRADITVIDMDKPHLTPVYDVYSHIVYALRSSDVYATIVDGKVLYEDGEYATIDIDDVMERVRRRSMELYEEEAG